MRPQVYQCVQVTKPLPVQQKDVHLRERGVRIMQEPEVIETCADRCYSPTDDLDDDLSFHHGAVTDPAEPVALSPDPALEQVQGVRKIIPSSQSAAATLLRRKSLLKKQDQMMVASSPLLRPPRLPVSRNSSVESSSNVSNVSAVSGDSRTKGSPRSPGACYTSHSGTDEERSPCPSVSNMSNGSVDTKPRGLLSEDEDDIPRAYGTTERTFRAFCGCKPGMDGKTFAKLCKDSNLVDKSLTKTDVDIIFAKVVQKGHRRMYLEQFDSALELIADKRGMKLEDVWSHVRSCGGPVLNSTKADAVRFYDDKSTYTGTHAQGGPDPGRKGRGTLTAWSSDLRDEVPCTPRDDPETPAAATATSLYIPFEEKEKERQRASVRTGSLSEKKIAQQLRGKDGTVEDTFKAYSGNKPDLDGKTFVKLCKDCEIIDDIFTPIDADLVFAKVVSRGHRRITLQQFHNALRMIAERKGDSEEDICRLVAESEGVLHAGTTAEYVRFFDDKSTYTGTHVYGGPDSSAQSSHDQLWSSMLRPYEDLPEMVVTKIQEASPTGATGRAAKERAVQPKAKPRARLAITAKGKPPQGDRDDFTMVFTDVQGSTSLWESNPRAMEMALRLHDATIRQVLAKHSGYEVTTEGDAFQIAFHDTCDAVAFCLDTQAELLRCDWPAPTLGHTDAAASSDGAWRGLRVRMGLHSGRPAYVTKHEVTGRWRYAGPSVAMAKAIEGVCHGGQIIMSASSYHLIDGMLTLLGSPQVVDLGEHILEGHGLTEDSSRTGCSGRAKVQLIQLVPDLLSHEYSCEDPADKATFGGGRKFPPIESEERASPGFEESPAGSSITLCFVFTAGARELVATDPVLASQSLGLLRGYLREVLRHAGDGSGYECQEDEGAFMLAFANMVDASVFSTLLQRKLPQLPWPAGLLERGPRYARGLQVSIGALHGAYTSRRPHATTGRADYFGTIVNRTARIAAAAHPGQVLLGGDMPLDADAQRRLPGLQWQQPPVLPGYPQMIPQPMLQPMPPQHAMKPPGYPPMMHGGYQTAAQPVNWIPGQPIPSPSPAPQPQPQGPGWSILRLGAFALKGIDSPIVLNELRLFGEGGSFDTFPEPKTKGRVSA
ncbi:unnamed protein product [Effrenium voratum]|uniref:Guanylate cyclase domain-containing protein n=1 Tax=Effrenium voratum TaxID=2562239 RepID=A0AA36MYD5_9DINO|nr:unnamed protein product [Effrenium voratum]CAJ1444605.1 unnamed protein product [Effrenium voratum]